MHIHVGRRDLYHLSEQCVCVHTNTLVRDTLIPVMVRIASETYNTKTLSFFEGGCRESKDKISEDMSVRISIDQNAASWIQTERET